MTLCAHTNLYGDLSADAISRTKDEIARESSQLCIRICFWVEEFGYYAFKETITLRYGVISLCDKIEI